MLSLVNVTNVRGKTLSLPMMDISSGYSVREIDGLDPVDAVLTTSTMAQLDGAQFQNARRDTRNITMKLGLEPDYVLTTVQSLRSGLYEYFMPKANIDLAFYFDGSLYAITSGQVESCSNAMFSADPEMDISIICYDPDFYGPSPEITSLDTVSSADTTSINYEGTSDAGVIFTLNVNRSLGSFALYNIAPDGSLQVFGVTVTDGTFIDGDVITITSIPGSRGISLLRGGLASSVLYYVDDSAAWITLQKGDNEFRAYADGDAIPCTLTYTPQFGGL